MRRKISPGYFNYLADIWNALFPMEKVEHVTSERPNRRMLARMILRLEDDLMLRGVNYGEKI